MGREWEEIERYFTLFALYAPQMGKAIVECDIKDTYYGETSYNAYTRGGEHLHKYDSNDPKSIMFQHDNLVHEGRKCEYQMSVTGTFHNDSTKRQIAEGL